MGGSGDGPDSSDFIEGYFKPGGQGYNQPSDGGDESVFDPTYGGQLAPVIGGGDENVFDPTYGGTMPTGGEYTGSFDDYLGNPNPPEAYTGSFDDYLGNPNEDYNGSFDEYLGNPTDGEEPPMPSVDEDFVPTEDVEEPDTEEPSSGGKGGGSGGGSKTAAKVGSALTRALTGGKAAAKPTSNPVLDALTAAATQQQNQQNALANYMLGDKSDVAHIKSYKELFGDDLFGDSYVPPSARDASDGAGYVPEGAAGGSDQGEELYKGGHVDDLDVDTLLQILRG
jgi:hypothetical protein